MDLTSFWELVDSSRAVTSDQDERLEWLTSVLASLPAGEIADFQVHLDRQRSRVDTWDHWAAAAVVNGGCSDDGCLYFQSWLVGLGREEFERIAGDPDALASVVTPGLSFELEWEELDYVAAEAFRLASGDAEGLEKELLARGHASRSSPAPYGAQWDPDDPAEVFARLPRLAALFRVGEEVA